MPICKDCCCRLNDVLNEKCKTCGNNFKECICTDTEDIRYLFYFDSSDSRKFVYNFKYFTNELHVRFWAKLLVKYCLKQDEIFDAVTFVPRSWLNQHIYGYDQSKELALELSRLLNIPFVDALKRKGFRRQKLLSKRNRWKHSMKLYKPRFIPEKKYKKLLLLDDIITTGSTILACKTILRGSVAKSVECVVLAKTNTIIK